MAAVGFRPVAAQDIHIEHVTVVSPEAARALHDADVWVRGGRIMAVSATRGSKVPLKRGAAAQTLDGRGLYLIPGLIDGHVHLGDLPGMTPEQEREHPDIALPARAQFPRSFLYFGFTTLIDLVSTSEGIARWKSHAPVPDTYFCGGAALMDGYPMQYLPKPDRYARMPYMIIEHGSTPPAGIEAAEHTPQAVVSRMKSDGAICVKTFFERGFGGWHDLPVPRPETIRALVRAAHTADIPVLLHANSAEAQTFALDTGIDIIAHGLMLTNEAQATGELTPSITSLLDRVVATRTGWQPTLQVLYGLQDLSNENFLAEPLLARALPRNLIAWYGTKEGQWFHEVVKTDFSVPVRRDMAATGYVARHGGRLLFGTDTPSAPTYANPPGLNGWLEIRHLFEAGVTPEQIFRMATLDNARAFHLDKEIGSVRVGMRANLLLVRADPKQTIDAYREIAKVILGGRVLDRRELAADRDQRL